MSYPYAVAAANDVLQAASALLDLQNDDGPNWWGRRADAMHQLLDATRRWREAAAVEGGPSVDIDGRGSR